MSDAKWSISDKQREIMLHALGSSSTKYPLGWRNYYCAATDDPELLDLVEVGLMKASLTLNDGRNCYFVVTDAGLVALGLDVEEIKSKAQRVKPRGEVNTTPKKHGIAGARADAGFRGEGYVAERDKRRLTGQALNIWDTVKGGSWLTLRQIAQATGAPEASVSATLRCFRRPSWGGHTVERDYLGNGLYQYRVLVSEGAK